MRAMEIVRKNMLFVGEFIESWMKEAPGRRVCVKEIELWWDLLAE